MLERFRFFATCQPSLYRKAGLYGTTVQYNPSRILAIESGPMAEVVDIQTSIGTFFAQGLASHHCFAKKCGCGAKFAEDAPEIVDQLVGDIENADPYDLLNTIL